jgi:transcriptional regulator with XRE-family HTH domain
MSDLINTGKMIQRHIHERIIRRTDLAKQMGVPHSAIYSYEKRSSISSHILLRICHATRHNFFADIARALPSDYTIAKGSPTDHASTLSLDAVIAQQAEEIKQLRIENNLLKELMKKG